MLFNLGHFHLRMTLLGSKWRKVCDLTSSLPSSDTCPRGLSRAPQPSPAVFLFIACKAASLQTAQALLALKPKPPPAGQLLMCVPVTLGNTCPLETARLGQSPRFAAYGPRRWLTYPAELASDLCNGHAAALLPGKRSGCPVSRSGDAQGPVREAPAAVLS